MKTSITDQPREPKQEDRFNISQYEDGLCTFLSGADTPLTIALQGEWGSGKTSLMNSLRSKLCEGASAKFKHIWINTWEYALMSDPETTLTQIISQITSQIARIFSNGEDATKKIKDCLKKFFKAAAKTTVAAISGGDSSPVEEFWGESEESSLGELRNELKKLIITYKVKNPECQGLIFFIDDLDRINPISAVQLMELMKNLFTLDHCIFVLAIDYEVVVKGLKPKFGEMSDKNEHEFRSFFDKIIQVPFSMPVKQYEVTEFIFNALSEIEYFTDKQQLVKYREDIEEIVRLSVGTNPRSIKRLINSTSLVKCIYGSKEEIQSYENRFLNFAFIALQSVYPKFYQLLHDNPDFTSWGDEKFLYKHHIPAWTEQEKADLKKDINEYANELWEGAIKKFCDKSTFLQHNFLAISHIFNIIRNHVTREDGSINTDLISKVIKLSQTTNTQVEAKNPREYSTNTVINTIYAKLKNVTTLSKKTLSQGVGVFEVGNNNPFEFRLSVSFKRPLTYLEIKLHGESLKDVSDKNIKNALKLKKGDNVELDGVFIEISNDIPTIIISLNAEDVTDFTSQDCINAISNLINEMKRITKR